MESVTRPQLFVYIAAVIAVGLVGARYLSDGRSKSITQMSNGLADRGTVKMMSSNNGHVVVHVAGAVRKPGVYSMARNARVTDAIKRAGGETTNAQNAGLNLAARLSDGQQIVMPSKNANVGGDETENGQKTNLNTADVSQLDQLDGVGPAMAEKIIEERNRRGGFGSVQDLDQIPGIGEKRLESLKEQLSG